MIDQQDSRYTSKRITINGNSLRYLDWGSEGKPHLVCLHGHTGQAHIWEEFAEAMSEHYHVLALDQRGHGESEWADDGYARDRFVDDVAAFVDALGLEKFVLAGLSMGGWHSMLYTAEHADRVERIIMVDIGPEPSQEATAPARPPTPMEFGSVEDAIAWAREGNPWASDDRLASDMNDKLKDAGNGNVTWKADTKLFNTPLPDMTDPGLIGRYWNALETIPCPILEVRGAESPLVSDDVLDRMKAWSKALTSMDIPDAGHVVTVDKPYEFIEATRAFLGVPAAEAA
ncbi:MAG: alpha/beta hydrolase [SAR202 cluster bacterium]|jgi:pimeloyl-ACP methyl ester carboxylesterase|nr:alpha/beta hydrolase [SAR202 cluster bacterium]MDP7412110.1 alpha/beta hydrolase [SAR202 cluster bacterium]